MTQGELYEKLRAALKENVQKNGLAPDAVRVFSRALSPKEAIGQTARRDYPILTGKEVMLQADYMGEKGQAFTDAPADFSGTLTEILQLDLVGDAHARGLFIASMNAVFKKLGLIKNTVHCKGEEPEECARDMASFIKREYGQPKIALVGYQPALIDRLQKAFSLRVLDLNPENIGRFKYGVRVEDGQTDYKEVALNWAELVLCTGSTLCNGTIVNFIDTGKQVLFFGTTVAAAAQVLGLKRLCFCAA